MHPREKRREEKSEPQLKVGCFRLNLFFPYSPFDQRYEEEEGTARKKCLQEEEERERERESERKLPNEETGKSE